MLYRAGLQRRGHWHRCWCSWYTEELCSFGIAQVKAAFHTVLEQFQFSTGFTVPPSLSPGAGFTGAVPEWGVQDLALEQKGQSLCPFTHMHNNFISMRYLIEFKCVGSRKAQSWAQWAPPGSRLTDICKLAGPSPQNISGRYWTSQSLEFPQYSTSASWRGVCHTSGARCLVS